jgi:aspartyl-tRNA(Asn)/glutamyl-tRNA(Gln) amidotransferase subunit A
MPSRMSAQLWSLTAHELVDGYRSAAFTPVDAMQSILDRLDAVNPKLNAIIALDRDGALRAARESAVRWKNGCPLSDLDGVPVSVKDNLYLKGLPATWGSLLLVDFIPDRDETPIALLRAAGLVLFGKTNVPEFTIQGYTSNLVFGPTFNPHAPGKTPGGSTGGGAAAVAAGIGPFAIGTDGGGSIRRPAAHCGLFALKPSIGKIPRYDGFPQILSDFEVIGVIGRSAADLESLRQILEVPDARDPRSLASPVTLPPLPDKPRVAFMPTIGTNPVDPQIAAEVGSIARGLAAAGSTVQTIEAPFDYDRVTATWGTVMMSGLAWYLSGVPCWMEKVNPSARAVAEEGATRTAGQLLDALATVVDVRRAAGEFFERYDLLLCPAAAALAWPAESVSPPEIDGKPVGPRGHAVFTAWMNVAGVPAVTVPLTMTQESGGIGLQLVAGHGRDRDLLRFVESCPIFRNSKRLPLAEL